MSGDIFTVSKSNMGQELDVLMKTNPYCSLLEIENDVVSIEHGIPEEEDRRLRRWKDWVEIRNKECQKLAALTQRPSIDLVMNSEQHFREVKERQRILQLAQREPIATLLNGTPWEMPPRLRQRCPCEPIYEVTRTSPEKKTELEYVAVPDQLRSEKALNGVSRRKNYTFNDSKYRAKREKELKDKMRSLEPHRPQIHALMIDCVKDSQRKNVPSDNKITKPFLHTVTEPDTDSLSFSEQTEGICAIRINNTVFIQEEYVQGVECLRKLKEQPWHVDTTKWHYSFKAYTRQNHAQTLTMQNLGTVAIRYYWRPADKFMPQSWTVLQNPVFFFKKGFDVLLPGQTEQLSIDFVPCFTGVNNEVWELKFCQVPLTSLSKHFLLFLEGTAIDEMSLGDDGVDSGTEKTNEDLVLDILNLIIYGLDLEKPPLCPYNQLFVERDMFLMRNPLCYYHPTKVNLLKQMHENLEPEAQWNLSAMALRECLKKKTFKERSELYQQLVPVYADLLKPWPSEVIEDLKTTKIIGVKLVFGHFIDLFDEEFERLKSKQAWGVDEEEFTTENVETETVDIPIQKDLKFVGEHPEEFDQEHEYIGGEEDIHENLVPSCKEAGFAMAFYFTMYQHLSDHIENIAGTLDSINIYKHFDFNYENI